MANKKITAKPLIVDVDINNDQMVIVDVSDTTQDPSGTTKRIPPVTVGVALGIQNLAQIAAAASIGTLLTFLSDSVYGSVDAPESGNITVDVTGAKLGVTNLILHQNGAEPTYPANFVLISGTYDPAKVNRILCVYLDDNTIDYSISQPQ